MPNRLTKKNHDRRFGTYCAFCGKKIGRASLDGRIDGRSVRFCSFKCHDDFMDRREQTE